MCLSPTVYYNPEPSLGVAPIIHQDKTKSKDFTQILVYDSPYSKAKGNILKRSHHAVTHKYYYPKTTTKNHYIPKINHNDHHYYIENNVPHTPHIPERGPHQPHRHHPPQYLITSTKGIYGSINQHPEHPPYRYGTPVTVPIPKPEHPAYRYGASVKVPIPEPEYFIPASSITLKTINGQPIGQHEVPHHPNVPVTVVKGHPDTHLPPQPIPATTVQVIDVNKRNGGTYDPLLAWNVDCNRDSYKISQFLVGIW